jgi:hypothetical protein
VQGGGQAQHPQCRHQAPRQQYTKNPLKKLIVHVILIQSFIFLSLGEPCLSCLISPVRSFLSCVLNCIVVSLSYSVLFLCCPVLSTCHVVSAIWSVLSYCVLHWHGVFSSRVLSCPDVLFMLVMLFLLFIKSPLVSRSGFFFSMKDLFCLFVLSCPFMSCHVKSFRILSCPIFSFYALSCPVLSYSALSCSVMSRPVLSCLVLSCPVPSHPVSSCLALSRNVLKYLALSYLSFTSLLYYTI